MHASIEKKRKVNQIIFRYVFVIWEGMRSRNGKKNLENESKIIEYLVKDVSTSFFSNTYFLEQDLTVVFTRRFHERKKSSEIYLHLLSSTKAASDIWQLKTDFIGVCRTLLNI